MDTNQESRKRKLAALKAKRAQSNLANAALVEKEAESSKRSPPKAQERLPGPDEVYTTSIFGAGGATGQEGSEQAAPLLVWWGTGDMPAAPNSGSPPPQPPRPFAPRAGVGRSPPQPRHQPPHSGQGQHGMSMPFPGSPASLSAAPPSHHPSSRFSQQQQQQQLGRRQAPRGPYLPHPRPPPPPPQMQQQQQHGQPMKHYLPGDPRGGHPPPPPPQLFVPPPHPGDAAAHQRQQQQAGFHGMAGRGHAGQGGGGGGRGGPQMGGTNSFQQPPTFSHYGPGAQQPSPAAASSSWGGRGGRGGRGRGGGGRAGRGGQRYDGGGRGGGGGLFKASYVEDPWKDLLLRGPPRALS